jgi:hypothetical protein
LDGIVQLPNWSPDMILSYCFMQKLPPTGDSRFQTRHRWFWLPICCIRPYWFNFLLF